MSWCSGDELVMGTCMGKANQTGVLEGSIPLREDNAFGRKEVLGLEKENSVFTGWRFRVLSCHFQLALGLLWAYFWLGGYSGF